MPDRHVNRSIYQHWTRWLPVVVILLTVCLFSYGIIRLPPAEISAPGIGLVTSLVWPSLILILAAFYRAQIEDLISQIGYKIQSAKTLDAAGVFKAEFETKVAPDRIPIPQLIATSRSKT
jgi:hypothetical protein